MNRWLVSGVLLALSGVASAASVNLIQNGSFEAPEVTNPRGWDTYYGASVPNWNTTTFGIEIRENAVGTAYDGDQFVELDTTQNSAMWQAISTVLGQVYELTFAYSPRIGQSSATNPIEVLWNGASLATVTGIGGSTHNWQLFKYLVTGTGSDVLRFEAEGTSDSLGGSLDMVSLTAVPLPGAAILFGTALLGAGVMRSRMKKASLSA